LMTVCQYSFLPRPSLDLILVSSFLLFQSFPQ
jgi:hypothetical protein